MGRGLTELLGRSLGCENLGGLVLQEKGLGGEARLWSVQHSQGSGQRIQGQSATDHDYDGHFPQSKRHSPLAWPFCT